VEWFSGTVGGVSRAAGIAGKILKDDLPRRGTGVATLALLVARQACAAGGILVVVDREGWFYPPAAVAWGIDAQRLIWVRARRTVEELWAVEQSLRCPAVAAVWSCLRRFDDRWFRRFQLAAEQSGCLGMFVRKDRYRGQPSWAEVGLAVTPATYASEVTPMPTKIPDPAATTPVRRLQVELVRCRGPGKLNQVVVELNELTGAIRADVTGHHETHSVPVVSELAAAKAVDRTAGA
jgi:hypothetical protein